MTRARSMDPCRPWYLRIDADSERARVWQATDPEPTEWMIEEIAIGNVYRYVELITGIPSAGGGELIIDAIDVTVQQGT